jgi:hypothetical protein
MLRFLQRRKGVPDLRAGGMAADPKRTGESRDCQVLHAATLLIAWSLVTLRGLERKSSFALCFRSARLLGRLNDCSASRYLMQRAGRDGAKMVESRRHCPPVPAA